MARHNAVQIVPASRNPEPLLGSASNRGAGRRAVERYQTTPTGVGDLRLVGKGQRRGARRTRDASGRAGQHVRVGGKIVGGRCVDRVAHGALRQRQAADVDRQLVAGDGLHERGGREEAATGEGLRLVAADIGDVGETEGFERGDARHRRRERNRRLPGEVEGATVVAGFALRHVRGGRAGQAGNAQCGGHGRAERPAKSDRHHGRLPRSTVPPDGKDRGRFRHRQFYLSRRMHPVRRCRARGRGDEVRGTP